jgi:hypothetical protein
MSEPTNTVLEVHDGSVKIEETLDIKQEDKEDGKAS